MGIISKQSRKTWQYVLAVLMTATLLFSPSSYATEAATPRELQKAAREYHLKAAFLRYVAKFVEWPADVIPEGKINICVLGQVPYYKGIDSINGKVVNDREINVQKVASIEDAQKDNQCQILYVAKTEANNMEAIIKELQDKPILGFGDMDKFAESGGDMNFYIMNNRLAIMINPPAVERSKLKISPRMLKLVTVIPPIDQSMVN